MTRCSRRLPARKLTGTLKFDLRCARSLLQWDHLGALMVELADTLL